MNLHKKYIINFLIFICFLLTYSCKEDIDLGTDSTTTKLVVEGYISTDTMRHMVRLSKSSDALHKQFGGPVTDAIVTISDGIITETLTKDESNPGFYFTSPSYFGVAGKTYVLNIKNVDVNNDGILEEYRAKSLLKDENPIDAFNVIAYSQDSNLKGWIINLYAQDPGKGRNCYLMKIKKNNTMLTDSVYKYGLADNTGFEGKYYYGFPVYFLRESIDSTYNLIKGDTVTLEMYGITEEYFTFLYDFINDYYPKLPIFSGPSANAYSNIEPGEKAIGVFTAYSVKRKKIVYK